MKDRNTSRDESILTFLFKKTQQQTTHTQDRNTKYPVESFLVSLASPILSKIF